MITGTPPEARIYMLIDQVGEHPDPKIRPYSGEHLLYRFDDFTDIEVDLPVRGMSSASITFDNKYDRFFKWEGDRSDFSDTLPEETALLQKLIWLDLYKPLHQGRRKERQTDKLLYLSERASKCLSHFPIMPFGLMNRVFIDFKGRDGKWYAAFSGFVTNVVERTTKSSGSSTIIVKCSGFRRLLSLTPFLTYKEAQLWPSQEWYTVFEKKELEDKIKELMDKYKMNECLTNRFAGVQPRDIMLYILDVIHYIYNGEGKTYWGNDNFWEKVSDYSAFKGSGKSHIRPDEPSFGDYISTKGFYIDELLGKDSDYKPYKQLVRDGFALFGAQMDSALKIFEYIASMVMGYVYIDAVGNLIYELPKYNHFPKIDYLESDEDQKDLKDQYFHGPNYIAHDDSLISWNIGESESPIMTKVMGTREFDLITVDGALNTVLNNQHVLLSEDEQIRFGFRNFSTQTLFYGGQLKKEMSKEVFKKYLEAVLGRLNSSWKNMSITFNQRPDFLLNRTIVLLERETVGLITKIHHSFHVGDKLTSTVTCDYCRNIKEKIPEPWRVFEEKDPEITDEEYKKESGDLTRYGRE